MVRRQPVVLLILLAVALGTSQVSAWASDWACHSSPVPTAISGTLSPLSLAIDGKPVMQDENNAASVEINGRTASLNPGENRPFFDLTTSPRIQIAVHLQNGTIVQKELRFPSLESVSVLPDTGELRLKSDIPVTWKLDDVPLGADGETNHWHPPDESWYKTPHTLEVSAGGASRSYNLSFEKEIPSSRAHRILAAAGISNTGQSEYLLEYAYRTTSNWQWAIGAAYQSDPTLNTEGIQIELEHALFGKLDLGVFARALVYGGAIQSTDGDSTVLPQPGVQAGPLLQYEIWRTGILGFFVRAEEAIRITGDNASGAQIGGGIQLAF